MEQEFELLGVASFNSHISQGRVQDSTLSRLKHPISLLGTNERANCGKSRLQNK